MSIDLYASLSWLPQPPADFAQRCKRLPGITDHRGREARALASYALDENNLNRLARTMGKCESLQPLSPFRLGVLSNSTTDFLLPALTATAARYGLTLECVCGNYDQVIQEALTPDSKVNVAKCDAVLLSLDHRSLPLRAALGSAEEADRAVTAALGFLDTIRRGIQANSGALCILQTIPPPPERLFGSLDRMLPGTLRNLIERVNSGLAERVFSSNDMLLDVAGLAETVGLSAWHDATLWNLAKLPFASNYLPLYADHVCRILAALRGKSRKCLVLDLDNTVWGGVIGDDGLEGIQCAQGDPTGEAHLGVQRLALDLRSRGIVLAVSSKNNDDVARLPFREHPEMLLREEHIAVFQANWNDKATNIQAIANELSLGIDSMVLLDDNPAERALVRQMLPEVGVPELPADPALYARTLAAAGYFEAVIFSEEDTKRAGFYQDNARRVQLQSQAGDLDAYLASLNMEITFQPFDATGRARIAQLINKSNQFNLTTRRYTEADVAHMETDPTLFTLQVRLSDAFGDNGMISVIICRRSTHQVWDIDTWLMSCRVLGRRVEQMVLRHLLSHARQEGVRTLVGTFIPTDRNKLVVDHYSKLGFTPSRQDPNGTTVWELDVATAEVPEAPMRVRSLGFELLTA